MQARRLHARLAEIRERDAALSRLVAMYDPQGRQSTDRLSRDISARLARFQGAYQRIDAGHREPRNPEESALATVCRVGPCSARKLFDLLAEIS